MRADIALSWDYSADTRQARCVVGRNARPTPSACATFSVEQLAIMTAAATPEPSDLGHSGTIACPRYAREPGMHSGEAVTYIEWLPEALRQEIICQLGVAAFELACTSRLYLIEVRMAQDEGRLSKSKISRALINAGFPAIMANCSEGTAARRHMVEAGRPGPGPSALFWTGWIRGSRTSTHHRRAIDMFEVTAILYWLWKQRRRVRRMLVLWLSRTGKAEGQAMPPRDFIHDTPPRRYGSRANIRSSEGGPAKRSRRAAGYGALLRRPTVREVVYPAPLAAAAVDKASAGRGSEGSWLTEGEALCRSLGDAGDSTPSYEALRCAARNAAIGAKRMLPPHLPSRLQP